MRSCETENHGAFKSFSASPAFPWWPVRDGLSARQAQEKLGGLYSINANHQSRLFSTGKSADFFIDIVSGKLERAS